MKKISSAMRAAARGGGGSGEPELEGLRETAATLAMPRASAARFRRRLSENS